MAAFFSDLLDDFLGIDFLKKVHKKFHYTPEQMETLLAVAQEMLPRMRAEAFWERRLSDAQICGNLLAAKFDEKYEDVVISLGYGLDELQENYSQKGMLLESYMLETLASELLLQSYGSYNRYTLKEGKWHVARYHFPGSEENFPLELLPKMLQGITNRVACNSALCMQPKKSVAFVAELTQDAKRFCEGICTGCGSMDCPNRGEDDSLMRRLAVHSRADMPLTYGYARIFGK
ncbi:hypothetical protein [Parablautia muri]|uniref:Uncharacterized protein n=1 Tax=Parablautia muri TaxID=2320879 RepID=A0A9X5GS96_9FIRM|nr:hypothetical protein [Parablautia muri]NBJ93908.1 hypothetical protein [Parablautia muri]